MAFRSAYVYIGDISTVIQYRRLRNRRSIYRRGKRRRDRSVLSRYDDIYGGGDRRKRGLFRHNFAIIRREKIRRYENGYLHFVYFRSRALRAVSCDRLADSVTDIETVENALGYFRRRFDLP